MKDKHVSDRNLLVNARISGSFDTSREPEFQHWGEVIFVFIALCAGVTLGALGGYNLAQDEAAHEKRRTHFLSVCTANHPPADCRKLWEATR